MRREPCATLSLVQHLASTAPIRRLPIACLSVRTAASCSTLDAEREQGHRACVVGAPRAPPRPSPPGLLASSCAPPTIQPTQTHVSMLIPASSGFRSAACTYGTPAPKRREARRNRSVPTPSSLPRSSLISSPAAPHSRPCPPTRRRIQGATAMPAYAPRTIRA